MRPCAFLLLITYLFALPEGPKTVAGAIQGPHLQNGEWVIQSGHQTIVEWNRFSIDAQETLHINQADSHSSMFYKTYPFKSNG